jgi:glycosyltransferase involved in cell wall biosynthesis
MISKLYQINGKGFLMKNPKRKILFTIPTLQAGGAERVLVNLLNYWAQRQDLELFLLVHDRKGQQPFYALDSNIAVVYTGHWRGWKRLFLLFSTCYHIYKINPDVTIGFILWNNILTAIASRIIRIPSIVSERNTLHVVQNFFIKKFRDFAYSFSGRIIVQTDRAKVMLSKPLQEKTCVITNPVIVPSTVINYKNTNIVAMGRLTNQKGFDLLIDAFSLLAKENSQWTLTIWGEGDDRAALEEKIQRKDLTERVFLPGSSQEGIFNELSKASIFALTSRFEGMPNALCEAMGLGLAVVATDCLTGPRELIDDKKDGFLVPVDDIDALVKALKILIQDEFLRKEFGQKAAEKMKRYDIKTIAGLWEQTWEKVLGKK